MKQSQEAISQYFGGIPVKSFAAPLGEVNLEVIDMIKKYYDSERGADGGFNTKESFDPYNIKAMPITSTTSASTIIGWIDQAIQDKSWLVLVYHDIRPDDGSGFEWTNTPQDLEVVLSTLKSKGVAVKTTSEAVSELLSQF